MRARLWTLVSLSLWGFSACGDADLAPPSPNWHVSPISAADCQGYTTLSAFKAANSSRSISTNPQLSDCYRFLLAKEQGADPNQYATDFESRLLHPIHQILTSAQASAWRSLHQLTRGLSSVSWDATTLTPDRIELGLELPGADGPTALAALERAAGQLVRQMFAMDAEDTLALADTTAFTAPAGDLRASLYRLHYTRSRKGLPSFHDWYDVAVRSSEHGPGYWVGFVSGHWTRDLTSISTEPLLSPPTAVAAALAHGEVPEGQLPKPATLGFYTASSPADLAYEVHLANAEGARWRYYVSAGTGEVLFATDDIVRNYSGSLKIPVARPLEDATTSNQPLPYATIYENPATSSATTCDGVALTQTSGSSSRVLTTTSLQGTYADVPPLTPGDTSWLVDYRGTYVKDKSYADPVSGGARDLTEGFTAGGSATLTANNYDRRRRGQLYYMLNWGSRMYREGAAYNIIPQCAQLGFTFWRGTNDQCSAPTDVEAGCYGNTSTTSPCIYVECYCPDGVIGHPTMERRFRAVALHEQNHCIMLASGGTLYGDIYCNGTYEAGCYEEGRVMFAALAMGKFEFGDQYYQPDVTYPTNYTGGIYNRGHIWNAIYSTFMLNTGIGSSLNDVHFALNTYGLQTKMVGSCTDTNGNGRFEVSECPANSYYRKLLAADDELWFGQYQRGQEISQVFHDRVTDADRIAPGVQAFAWADDLPNFRGTPPFTQAAEVGNSPTVIQYGPAGNELLRLERIDDYDVVMFLGRAGQTYLIETQNLSAGTDTVLEVFDDGLTSAPLISNDDCPGSGVRSCLTFSPATTNYYRVRVSPKVNSSTGPDKTYQLKFTPQNDDYGNTQAAAATLTADGTYLSANFSSGDVDVFKVPSPTTQTLSYLGCSGWGFPVNIQLYAGATMLQSSTFNSCADAPASYTVGAGVYFLRVTQPSGLSGSYQFKATTTADIDIDSTSAHAWTLSNDPAQGRVLATRFETLSDVDWYKFTSTQSGAQFVIETFALGANVNTELELYAPASTGYGRTGALESMPDTSGGQGRGHWMLKDRDSGLTGSRLAFVTPIAGTYYVRVKSIGTAAGRYSLAFSDVGRTWYPYVSYH